MYKSSIYFLLLITNLSIKAQTKPFEPTLNKDGWKIKNELLANPTIIKKDSLIILNKFKEISSVVIAIYFRELLQRQYF